MLEQQANGEILEKAGIPPPSYKDVVVNQAMEPEPHIGYSKKPVVDEKHINTDLLHTESFHEVADGMQFQDSLRSAQRSHVGAPGQYFAGPNVVYRSKCERKRAEKLARKAEQNAAKLAAIEMRM